MLARMRKRVADGLMVAVDSVLCEWIRKWSYDVIVEM